MQAIPRISSQSIVRTFSVIAATSCLTTYAVAGGFYVPGTGAPALGSGAAFVAGGVDPTALWHNPANLADLDEGFHLSFDFAGVLAIHNFQMDPNGYIEYIISDPDSTQEGEEGEETRSWDFDHNPVRNQAGPMPIPTFVLAKAHGNWAIAAGIVSPYQGDYTYGFEDPTRYTFVSNGSYTAYPSVGIGYAWNKRIRVGASFQGVVWGIKARQAGIWPFSFGRAGEDIDIDIDSMGFDPNFNAGVTLLPREGFRVAVAVQSGIRDSDDLQVSLDIPDVYNLMGFYAEGNHARTELKLPWLVRGGAAYEVSKDTWVEVDLHRELWGIMDELVIEPTDIVVHYPDFGGGDEEEEDEGEEGESDGEALPTVVAQQQMRDIWSVRAGIRRHLEGERLGWSLGVTLEEGATPTRTYNVGGNDADRIGFSGGIEYGLGTNWWFNLAASHYLHRQVVVEYSILRPVTTGLPPDLVRGGQVANGVYNGSNTVVVAGLRYRP